MPDYIILYQVECLGRTAVPCEALAKEGKTLVGELYWYLLKNSNPQYLDFY